MPYPEIVGSNPTRSSLICVHMMTRLWQRNNSHAGSAARGTCADAQRDSRVGGDRARTKKK